MKRWQMFSPKPTMNRFLHGMATAAVLVHMVCGCCWHHAHAHGARDHLPSDAAQTLVAAACDHRGGTGPIFVSAGHRPKVGRGLSPLTLEHDHFPRVGSDQPCDPHRQPCKQGACDFVRTESDAAWPSSLASPLVAPARAEIAGAVGLAGCDSVSTGGGPRPSVLWYLVIQKLLV